MEKTKICSKCKIEKHKSEFFKNKYHKDGLHSNCKQCSTAAIMKSRVLHNKNGLCSKGCGNKLSSTTLCQNCLTKANNDGRIRSKKNRLIVLLHYGNKCTCCGETQFEFLSFEHKNGDGAKHRKEIGIIGGGRRFVSWLIKNNFPDFIEILCYNCNCAKGYWGICPHIINGR